MADYLYSEALPRLSEDDQRFLRRTAVLDHLSAPLCDAVVGEPGAQEQLRQLEAANLFLVPLDRRREWYRYHGLFREFLLGELRRVEPDVVAELHVRAADWYESNGSPGMAVEHLLHTAERDRCAQLVAALVLPTYEAGQISTVQRWLTALGDAADCGVSAARGSRRLDHAVQRADRRADRVGCVRRRRNVRSRAVGRLGVVRVGASDVAISDVPRTVRCRCWPTDVGGCARTGLEPLARHGAVHAGRGAPADR